MKYIYLDEIIQQLNLEILHMPQNKIKVYKSDILRPGLQLSGYFDIFAYERIQIIGNTEMQYINTMAEDIKKERFRKLFSYEIPAVIFAKDLSISRDILSIAEENGIPLLMTQDKTAKLISNLVNFLEEKLAEEINLHGVFLEVYGIGVLLRGKSGIGKSEMALDLIKRGHRLVSDDAVVLYRVENTLYGTSPSITRHLLEIRGVGIIDANHMFGVSSVKIRQKLHLIIDLEEWGSPENYDRLGFDSDFETIFNVKIYKTTIPVKVGRNMAMIIEVAAMNLRQKLLGYSIEDEYNKRIELFTKTED